MTAKNLPQSDVSKVTAGTGRSKTSPEVWVYLSRPHT